MLDFKCMGGICLILSSIKVLCRVGPWKYSEIRGEIRFYIDLIDTYMYALSYANKMAQLSILFK
jgi:hypothetical protein